MQPRTDLAMEAKALYERSAQEQTQLSGVAAREQERHGVRMTVVKITSAEGEQALGKPRGTYITAELEALSRREPGSFSNAVRTVSRALRELLGPCRQALVVGLGNRDITPDAIGPEAVKNLIVTRHLQTGPDEALPGLMRVAACQPGVLGQTGIESLELVKCAMQTAQPDVVIVIDALTVMDQVRDRKNTDEQWIESITLREAISRLSEREKRILALRFEAGRTQMEVAGQIGISQAQVSRLEKSAIRSIRKAILPS